MWQKNVRYLDYNASAGLAPSVRQELSRWLENPDFFAANPSSRHRLGQRLQQALYRAKLSVAQSLGENDADRLVLTSSGTESNQTVIRSALRSIDQGSDGEIWVAIGAGDHSASYDLLESFSSDSIQSASLKRVRWIEVPLSSSGQVDLEQFYNLLIQIRPAGGRESDPRELWISLAWANHETGVVLDLDRLHACLEQLRKIWSHTQIRVHLDGAQIWGKVPIKLADSPADFATFSSHKIGAPAGVGVIWSRNPHLLQPMIRGTQNQGWRGGTENWLGWIALGVAAQTQASREAIAEFQARTAAIRDRFESRILESEVRCTIWGQKAPRVTNTSRVSFDAYRGQENWVDLLDLRGFAVSHGSACHSQVMAPSRVLLKMGASESQALNSIRVSFGPQNSLSDADDLVACLVDLDQNKKKSW